MPLSPDDQLRLDTFWSYCAKHQYFNIGYPESADFDYQNLDRFMRYSINNCGDWAAESNYLLNTFDFEKDVMRYFADLFQLRFEESWGYVTNGGTEGNMFGLYIAREMFPDGILYCSEATHYSARKIARVLSLRLHEVRADPTGEIDYDDLLRCIKTDRCAHPIVLANIGTTMHGAVDDVCYIQSVLSDAGFDRQDYYVHADAALSGMILPFVAQPQPYSFADGIDSIAVSGHKMIGTPVPCGVVVVRRRLVDLISVKVDYIASLDCTISGSRNGHSVLMLWDAIRSRSDRDWNRRIQQCLNLSQYTVDSLVSAGINAWRHRNSITVVFPCPPEHVWRKHCLASTPDWSHVILTGHHIDTRAIDAVINDLIPQCQIAIAS